jgi:hypothetical protein
MHLKRIIPGSAGAPQVCVYSCHFCGVSLTESEQPREHRSSSSGPPPS